MTVCGSPAGLPFAETTRNTQDPGSAAATTMCMLPVWGVDRVHPGPLAEPRGIGVATCITET
ncbi:hypothetical protein GCM10007061_04210 [Kocuria marina]|nr:hypothetical protein GCM10007061_04210 [Kocuria marina]